MNKHILRLKEIAEAMGATFIYETPARVGLLLDKVKRTGGKVSMAGASFPVCICMQPVAGAFDFHRVTGDMKDRQNCIVAFGEPMPLDFTGEQAAKISERLKSLALEFIERINNTTEYEGLYGQVQYEVGYDRYDACLCLVTIRFTLVPVAGECVNIPM
jgi:hypothetical protein